MYARRGGQAQAAKHKKRAGTAQWWGRGGGTGKRPTTMSPHHGAAGRPAVALRQRGSGTAGRQARQKPNPRNQERRTEPSGSGTLGAPCTQYTRTACGVIMAGAGCRVPWSVDRVDDGPTTLHRASLLVPLRRRAGYGLTWYGRLLKDVGYCEADRPGPSPSQRGPCKRLAVVGPSPLVKRRVRSIGRRCPKSLSLVSNVVAKDQDQISSDQEQTPRRNCQR